MEMYDLKELRKVATKACEDAAKTKRDFADDAIIWSNLQCTSAQYCVDDDGHAFHRVIIEEAAPDSGYLAPFIKDELEAAGFQNIQVITEW